MSILFFNRYLGNNIYVTGGSNGGSGQHLITQKYFLDEISNSVIQQNQDFSIKIYPNPTNHSIYLQTNFPQNDNLQWHLYNSLGQRLNSQKLQIGRRNHEISFSNIHSGIYYLSIENDGQVLMTEKIVKVE